MTVGRPGPPPIYPLAVSTWGAEERRAAVAVIESGQTTMGVKVAEFEALKREIAELRREVDRRSSEAPQ